MTIVNHNQKEDGAEVPSPCGLSSQRSSCNPGCVAAPLSTKKRALLRVNNLTLYQDTNLEWKKIKGYVLHNNRTLQKHSVLAVTPADCNTCREWPHARFPNAPTNTPIFTPLHPVPVIEHTSFSTLCSSAPHNLQETKVVEKSWKRTRDQSWAAGETRGITHCFLSALMKYTRKFAVLQLDSTFKQTFCLRFLA